MGAHSRHAAYRQKRPAGEETEGGGRGAPSVSRGSFPHAAFLETRSVRSHGEPASHHPRQRRATICPTPIPGRSVNTVVHLSKRPYAQPLYGCTTILGTYHLELYSIRRAGHWLTHSEAIALPSKSISILDCSSTLSLLS